MSMEQEGRVVSELITLDEAIEWGKRGELCDLMTEDDQRQVAEWLRQARGANAAARWYTDRLRDASRGLRNVMTENTKLQEEIEAAKHDLSIFSGRIVELDAEDAKLRELVWDMCEWAYIDSCCDLQGEFADRMRELGVTDG